MSLEDIRDKAVSIMLDKERHLLYDMNAFAELEERYGSVQKALEELEKESLKAVRFILWAGLIHEDEKLKEKQVGKMLTLADLPDIVQPMMQAIMNALPKQNDESVHVQEEQEEPKNE